MAGEEGKGDAAECSRKWARIYPPLDKGEGEDAGAHTVATMTYEPYGPSLCPLE